MMTGANEALVEQFKTWVASASHDYCPMAVDMPDRANHNLWTFLAKGSITSCPSCAFGIRFKAMTENNDDPLDKGRWQHLWLKHCLSAETNYIFIVLKELGEDSNGSEINREKDVKALMKDSLLETNGALARLASGSAIKQNYLSHCEDWFLRRYNKEEARWCYDQRQQFTSGSRLDRFLDRLKFFFPRVIGSIIIGYLPLLFTGESWHVALSEPWGINLVLPLAALFLSFIYFFMEVKNNLEPGSQEYRKRAGKIFLYSLGVSLFIGCCLLPLIGVYLPPDANLNAISGQWPYLWIFFGWQNFFLFLKILLYNSPLALLIGIFVQILWEDKPVTYPL
ncbi:MAG: hypothetical protein FJ135_16310 [Deltaproteobacteria bacterium]|nr:hypothetical protein [Deltaproteobacteria bacterium]